VAACVLDKMDAPSLLRCLQRRRDDGPALIGKPWSRSNAVARLALRQFSRRHPTRLLH